MKQGCDLKPQDTEERNEDSKEWKSIHWQSSCLFLTMILSPPTTLRYLVMGCFKTELRENFTSVNTSWTPWGWMWSMHLFMLCDLVPLIPLAWLFSPTPSYELCESSPILQLLTQVRVLARGICSVSPRRVGSLSLPPQESESSHQFWVS